jgi:hypothetical protein
MLHPRATELVHEHSWAEVLDINSLQHGILLKHKVTSWEW